MDEEKLGIKPDVLFKVYQTIDTKARQLAPKELNEELKLAQDGRSKTRFYVTVSKRMAPHLMEAIQLSITADYGLELSSYLQKLQEQLMVQLFGPYEQTTFNVRL